MQRPARREAHTLMSGSETSKVHLLYPGLCKEAHVIPAGWGLAGRQRRGRVLGEAGAKSVGSGSM